MKRIYLLIIFVIFASFSFAQTISNQYYDVEGANGQGIRFWKSNIYKIHMGGGTEYQYGPVTDMSIKFNMAKDSRRGWVWGVAGQTPVAALNTEGKFQIANDFTALGNIFAKSHIYGRTVTNDYSNLYRFGGLFFTWNSANYGTNPEHSIRSTYGETWGDNLTINSYNHLRINLDANSNNSESFFEVGHDTRNTENVLMRLVSPSGNLGVGLGTLNPETKLEVNGHLTLNPNSLEKNVNIYLNRGTSDFGRYLYVLNSKQNEAAAGIKAGRLVISDTYAYADPAPNNLIVKGNIGIGLTEADQKLTLQNDAATFLNIKAKNNNSELLVGTDHNGGVISMMTDHDLYLRTGGNINRMVVKSDGNVGIGTNDPGEFKLAVAGKIKVQEVKVTLSDWPDYVFENSYSLPTLEEVETHIKEKGHLKDIPSATDVEENGVNLGEMDAMLLKKIEELTLYMIDLKKENDAMRKEITSLQKQMPTN